MLVLTFLMSQNKKQIKSKQKLTKKNKIKPIYKPKKKHQLDRYVNSKKKKKNIKVERKTYQSLRLKKQKKN